MKNPLLTFDIESTGLDTQQDRIVELCMAKLHQDGTREVETIKVNPTIPIPAGASEVHGIYDDDVKDLPTFKQYAKSVHEFIQGCDILGFNSNAFDCPMLYAEFLRSGIEWDYSQHNLIDAGNLFKIHERRTLEAALQFYCGREHEGAHSAESDVLATIDVFYAQLEKYGLTEMSSEELALHSNYDREMLDLSGKFSKNEDGEIVFNFGKHRGEPAKNHPDFLDWMINRANFAPDTNKMAIDLYYGN